MLAMSEIACVKNLTTTGLLERAMTTSDLYDLVRKTNAQCSAENFSVMIAAHMLVWDDVEGVQCSPREERERRRTNDASVISRLDGSLVGLGLLCPGLPVLDQAFLPKAKFATFSYQP